jgi:hypothetical protein
MNAKKLAAGILPFAIALVPALASAEVNQPQEIINRPRTTPKGQITVGGDLGILLKPSPLSLGLQVGGLYGVNEKLEVGASYGFALKDFEIKGDLGVTAAYGILNDGNLTVAADVGFGYDVNGSALAPLTVGAEVQFKINDKLAVFSPGHQLGIGLEKPNAIALSLPVSVVYQASPKIFAHVDTNIGNISIKDSATAFIFADNIPLAVGAFFSPSNTMDLGATLDLFDLKNAGDVIAAFVSARLHM